MTKIMKKLMLIFCSVLAVFCVGVGSALGLNTNKNVTAKAADGATVEFTGFGTHNNTAWSDRFDAVDLAFSGEFTAATQAITSGSITYTTPGGTAANFQYYWANINGCGTNVVELLCWKGAMTEGTALCIEGGTVIGGQTLPELNFVLHNGKWTNEPTVTFTGFGTHNNTAWNESTSYQAVYLEFDGKFTEATQTVTSGSVTYTKPGEVAANFQFNWANINNCGENVVAFVYGTGAMTEGTVLKIDAGTIMGGQALPELIFILKNDEWVKVATSAKYLGISHNMTDVVSNGRLSLGLQFDKPLSASVSTNLFDGNALNIYLDGVQLVNGNFSPRCYSDIQDYTVMQLLFKNALGSEGTYAEGVTLQNGTKLEIKDSIVNGYQLPDLTLIFDATANTWAVEGETPDVTPDEPEISVETANFVQLVNNGGMGNAWTETQRILFVQFDKALAPTTTSIQGTGTANNSGDLKDKMTLNGEAISMGSQINFYVNTFWSAEGTNATLLEIMFLDYTKLAEGDVLHIPAGTLFGDVALSEVEIEYNGTSWAVCETETPDPDVPPTTEEITFVKIDENINYYQSDDYYLTDLKFSFDTTTNEQYIWFGEAKEGYEDLASKIYWTAYGETTKNSFNIIFGMNGNVRLMDHNTIFPTPYATITIEEGAVIEGKSLPATTLYVGADGKWTTEEQTPPETPDEPEVPVETANFERVAACVMDGTIWDMHSILYVKFDKALAPTTTSIQGTGTANNSGDLKDKMTLNGEAISMGSQINFYLNTFYSAEGANTTMLEIMFVNSTASDYAKGTVLHIPEGTLFGEVALSEVTLTFNGTTWVDETNLTRVTFVEIDAVRNNDNVWGMNYVTILYFDKPLYTENMDTALAEQVAGDLGANLTVNGVTAKDLGVAITFNSLSEEGRYGLEIHVPVDNMPKFSEELSQIILEIKAETLFLNNILPELKFYLNEDGKWQTDEYTYVYAPPAEVELTGVSFRYNNDNNTWQSEGEWYLTVLEFSDFLTKTDISGSALPLGDKITLNGVKTSELGFLYGIGAYQTTMNVQYPKDALLSILDAPRIELTLAEAVAYGDSIIQPFKLYLHKQSIKWELIDGTDTTPPELVYDGTTEIVSSEGKSFEINVSAFDNEDNQEAVIYYVWSEGALDENGKLVKGTHTCTVVAVDKSGNETKLTLTVSVGDRDTEAPEITVADSISAVEGATPELTYKAVDNLDGEIICEVVWSEGALDENGKFVAGTHTMTLTATDLTGNTSTKEVTVTVIKVPTDDFNDDSSSSDENESSSDENESSSDESASSDEVSVGDDSSSVGCFGSVEGCATAVVLAVLCAYVLRKRKVK